MPFIIDGTTGFNLPSGADLTVNGNFTVSGTTTTINTETLTVDDNIIVLNNNEAGTPSENAGIEVERGTSTNVSIRWNEITDKWQFTNDGITYTDIGAGGDVVDDTTPQLGGDLYANGKRIIFAETDYQNLEALVFSNSSNNPYGTMLSRHNILHDFYLSNHEGHIRIVNHADDKGVLISTDPGDGGSAVTYFYADGSTGEVKLYHYGDQKFATKSTGVAITGTIQGASDAEIKTSPIRIHTNTISTNTTVASTENAVSGGPVTIADGVTVQVDGDWTVV